MANSSTVPNYCSSRSLQYAKAIIKTHLKDGTQKKNVFERILYEHHVASWGCTMSKLVLREMNGWVLLKDAIPTQEKDRIGLNKSCLSTRTTKGQQILMCLMSLNPKQGIVLKSSCSDRDWICRNNGRSRTINWRSSSVWGVHCYNKRNKNWVFRIPQRPRRTGR